MTSEASVPAAKLLACMKEADIAAYLQQRGWSVSPPKADRLVAANTHGAAAALAAESRQKPLAHDDTEYLNRKNAHERDACLVFDEAAHKYTILTAEQARSSSSGATKSKAQPALVSPAPHQFQAAVDHALATGSVFPPPVSQAEQARANTLEEKSSERDAKKPGVKSVTGFCGGFFNPDFIIRKIQNCKRWADDPTYEYFQKSKEEILQQWDFGRELGTELHRDIEVFLNRKIKLEDDFLRRKISTRLALGSPGAQAVGSGGVGDLIDERAAWLAADAAKAAAASSSSSSTTTADADDGLDGLIGQMAGLGINGQGDADATGGQTRRNSDGSQSSSGLSIVELGDDPFRVERGYFLRFLKEVFEPRNWVPYRTEWRLFDRDLRIAGTIDLVCGVRDPAKFTDLHIESTAPDAGEDGAADKQRGALGEQASGSSAANGTHTEPDQSPQVDQEPPRKVVLLDWKRTKKMKKKEYLKQLNMYRFLLEKNYNVEVTEMHIVRLHPTADTYDILEIEVNDDCVREALGDLLPEGALPVRQHATGVQESGAGDIAEGFAATAFAASA